MSIMIDVNPVRRQFVSRGEFCRRRRGRLRPRALVVVVVACRRFLIRSLSCFYIHLFFMRCVLCAHRVR